MAPIISMLLAPRKRQKHPGSVHSYMVHSCSCLQRRQLSGRRLWWPVESFFSMGARAARAPSRATRGCPHCDASS